MNLINYTKEFTKFARINWQKAYDSLRDKYNQSHEEAIASLQHQNAILSKFNKVGLAANLTLGGLNAALIKSANKENKKLHRIGATAGAIGSLAAGDALYERSKSKKYLKDPDFQAKLKANYESKRRK